jgi:hypothetical protein
MRGPALTDAQIEELVDGLRARYDPSAIDRETVYYLSLGDEPFEKWTVTLTPSSCSMVKGRTRDADCVLKLRSQLFLALLNGSFEPSALDLLRGTIKTNDVALLLRLRRAFGL